MKISEDEEFEKFKARIRRIKDPTKRQKAKELLKELWGIIVEN